MSQSPDFYDEFKKAWAREIINAYNADLQASFRYTNTNFDDVVRRDSFLLSSLRTAQVQLDSVIRRELVNGLTSRRLDEYEIDNVKLDIAVIILAQQLPTRKSLQESRAGLLKTALSNDSLFEFGEIVSSMGPKGGR